MEARGSKKFLFLGLLFSILIHLLLGLSFHLKQTAKNTAESVDVTIVEKPAAKKSPDPEKLNQIVEQSKFRVNDELDPKAKYLSRFNQKVVEETRAKQNGVFQNDAKEGQAPKNTHHSQIHPVEKALAKGEGLQKKTKDDSLKLANLEPKFDWDEAGAENPGLQSQTDDYLKGVKDGPQTLLTTQEFVYYSYYNRIKDRLRVFWDPQVREKINHLLASGRRLPSDVEEVTKVTVTLDKEGVLKEVRVVTPSGIDAVDDAATESFRLAAPFPHPPSGLIAADGTVKIPWEFVLNTKSDIFNFEPSVAVN